MDPRSFWAEAFGSRAKPPKHLDSNPTPAVIEVLAKNSGIAQDEFRRATVIAKQPALFPSWKAGRMRWVLLDPKSRDSGSIQFCPQCLASDAPYFRTVDRLGFVVLCPQHGTPLQDCCPCCGHSVDLLRFGQRFGGVSYSVVHCRRCGWDLRRPQHENTQSPAWVVAEGFPCLEEAKALQGTIVAGVEEGWMDQSGIGPIYTHLFLEGLRQIINLLCARSTAPRLLKALETRLGGIGGVPTPVSVGQGLCFENLGVQHRLWLMGIAGWLLGEWPTRFIGICQDAGLSASDSVQNCNVQLPFWYVDPLRAALGKAHVGWRDPSLPKKKQYSQKVLFERKFSQRLADREKRLDFIREHLALTESPAELAKLMREVGLYSKRVNLWCIQKSLKKLIPAAIAPNEWWRRVGTIAGSAGRNA